MLTDQCLDHQRDVSGPPAENPSFSATQDVTIPCWVRTPNVSSKAEHRTCVSVALDSTPVSLLVCFMVSRPALSVRARSLGAIWMGCVAPLQSREPCNLVSDRSYAFMLIILVRYWTVGRLPTRYDSICSLQKFELGMLATLCIALMRCFANILPGQRLT